MEAAARCWEEPFGLSRSGRGSLRISEQDALQQDDRDVSLGEFGSQCNKPLLIRYLVQKTAAVLRYSSCAMMQDV